MAKKKKKKKPVNGWVGAHRTRVPNFGFSSPKKRATTLNAWQNWGDMLEAACTCACLDYCRRFWSGGTSPFEPHNPTKYRINYSVSYNTVVSMHTHLSRLGSWALVWRAIYYIQQRHVRALLYTGEHISINQIQVRTRCEWKHRGKHVFWVHRGF